MKKLLLLAAAVTFLASCKKNFSCACKSVNPIPNGGYVNQTQYSMKEFNEQDAKNKCIKTYEDSGKAQGEYSCEVM